MVRVNSVNQTSRSRLFLANAVVCLAICGWLALIQPGMSYYWLIDPRLHAAIDAEEYGQLPDGRTLPGHPWHPPHDHPTSFSVTVSETTLENVFEDFYTTVNSAARQPSLQGSRSDAAVIATSANFDPPEPPPRVPD